MSTSGTISRVEGHDFSVQVADAFFHPEQRLEVSWSQDGVVHVIQAVVSDMNQDGYDLTSAHIAQQLPQLRSTERVPWRREARVELVKSKVRPPADPITVQTVDISSGGVRFSTSLALAPGDTFKLTVEGYEPMTAEVIRSGGLAQAWRHQVSAKWLHPVKIPAGH